MKNISTFSIVARDPITGEIGVAAVSEFLASGPLVTWAKAEAGGIATQGMINLDFGEMGLLLLKKGYTAKQVLDSLLAADNNREERQIGIVDSFGNSASFTGKKCMGWAGCIKGSNFTCQGYLLSGKETVEAMSESFLNSDGTLQRRLVRALESGHQTEKKGSEMRSASLLIVKPRGSYGEYNDRYIDLRVDYDEEPIQKLSELLNWHEKKQSAI